MRHARLQTGDAASVRGRGAPRRRRGRQSRRSSRPSRWSRRSCRWRSCGGLMGPYMRPIPIGASAAMVFSLVVAFVVTPWAARAAAASTSQAHHDARARRTASRVCTGRVDGAADRTAGARRYALPRRGVALLLLAAVALVPLKAVTVKMLPFDNKSEFQVIIDMPEGTPLEQTPRVALRRWRSIRSKRSGGRRTSQSYAGTAAPYNFNGLVRHYFLRRGATPRRPAGEPRVERTSAASRATRSPSAVRASLAPIAARTARDDQGGRSAAGSARPADAGRRDLRSRRATPDRTGRAGRRASSSARPAWSTSTGTSRHRSKRSTSSSTRRKPRPPACSASAVADAGHHGQCRRRRRPPARRRRARGRAHRAAAAAATIGRASSTLASLRIQGTAPIAVGEVTRVHEATEARARYHKNLQAVTYVTGDRRGSVREPGVCHPRDEQGARATSRCPRATRSRS